MGAAIIRERGVSLGKRLSCGTREEIPNLIYTSILPIHARDGSHRCTVGREASSITRGELA